MKTGHFSISLAFILSALSGACHGKSCGNHSSVPDTATDGPPFSFPYGIDQLLFNMEQDQIDASLSEISLLSEELSHYRENPLNLNSIGAEDLRKLGFLSEWQIADILHYRESYGQIVDWTEFSLHIPSLDSESACRLQQYCFLGPVSANGFPQARTTKAKHQFLVRYGQLFYRTKAYAESRYAGPPRQYYFKYAYNQQNRILLGFSAQQDAGEAFGKKGFDAYSGYFCLKETGPFRVLCIGTYRTYWGYGLAIGRSGNHFSSQGADMVQCSGTGITPYASGAEYGFLQGMAASLRFPGNWQLEAFFSDRKLDGKLNRIPDPTLPRDDRKNSFWESLNSLSENGYHRTESELAAKEKIRWQQMGWKTEKTFSRLRLGGIVSLYRFGGIYNPLPEKKTIPDRVLPNGNPSGFSPRPPLQAIGGNISFFYQYLTPYWHLFGEYAYGTPDGTALLQGIQWKPSETFAFSVSYQHFDRRYFSPYARIPNNRAPSASRPGRSVDNLQWKMSCPIGNRILFCLQGEWEKERPYPELPLYTYRIGGGIGHTGKFLHSGLYFHLAESKSRKGFSIKLKTEGEFPCGFLFQTLFENRNLNRGTLLIQDIGYKNRKGNFLLRIRAALFHTDSYQNRIYAYEHDVLYAASAPALYGKGCRLAFLAKQEIHKGLWIEIKYAHTLYDGVQVSGSGDNFARTYIRPEAKIQIRWKFQSRELIRLP